MSLLNFFRRSDYTSDTTQFIDQLKANKPTLEAEQRAGRALLWDKNLNRAEQAEYGEARVAQQPYVYGTASHPNGK
ncbi:Protein of unknown function [Polaromonas sp. YR568]|uniref:DUF3460 family protein n=1 Tax=Polaromonas sp. YR568 TaxID=1855301 RepID=UPI0008F3A588|nr:DUF3460 family protein [Polaromonas sp. YR568]SFU62859.1 Protein of unknown function [Polaromonas sp. YR568]